MFGLPRMLMRSLIFALAGLIAAFVLTVFRQRKFKKLQELQAKAEEETRTRLQEEWQRSETQKQPLLQLISKASEA